MSYTTDQLLGPLGSEQGGNLSAVPGFLRPSPFTALCTSLWGIKASHPPWTKSKLVLPRSNHIRFLLPRGANSEGTRAKLRILSFAQRWEDVGHLAMEAQVHGRWEPTGGALTRSRQRGPHSSFLALLVLLPKLQASGEAMGEPSGFSPSSGFANCL